MQVSKLIETSYRKQLVGWDIAGIFSFFGGVHGNLANILHLQKKKRLIFIDLEVFLYF